MTVPASETNPVVQRDVYREMYSLHVTAQQQTNRFVQEEEAREPILLRDNNTAASIARLARFAQQVFRVTTTELTEVPAEVKKVMGNFIPLPDSSGRFARPVQSLGVVLGDGRGRVALVNPVSGGRYAGEVIEIGPDGRARSMGGSHDLGFVELAAALTRP